MVRPNFELDEIAVEPMTLKEARAMRVTGWDGDIPETQNQTAPKGELAPKFIPFLFAAS